MNFTELNASGYNHCAIFYNAEFEDVLAKIVLCYNLMVFDNVKLSNDENKIRDVLVLNYLKNNEVRKKVGLNNFHFEREVPEDTTVGRTDIKIVTQNSFIDTSAYYIIECKRLDAKNLKGTTGLNALYIENGICRFISKTYSSHYGVNGMIGFIVEKLDIDENINCLNHLLQNSFTQAKTVKNISKCSFITNFNYCYSSTHTIDKGEACIYHIMFDFSNNIS